MTKYIIRLDDAAPNAVWQNWDRMEHLLDLYGVKPLVGVIPACKDPIINSFDVKTGFWERVNQWKGKNWTIAMHGYDHVYLSKSYGLNPVNNKSEFAGVSLKIQRQKIRDGVEIFHNHGIEPAVFFPPAHTLDLNTIEALKQESKIRIISDTIANAPYCKWGMTFVPQQAGDVRNIRFQFVTFCYHPNEMTNDDFTQLENFLKKKHKQFIPFPIEPSFRHRTLYDWILKKLYFFRRIVVKSPAKKCQ